ncbi:MAG: DUF2752 domain-containing protein [Planctomycetota bacterium]
MITTIPVQQGPRPVWLDRAVAVAVVLVAATCAAYLWGTVPDERGFGTHEQLGMTRCSWPTAYGMPCPTCGATTAASMVVHGRLWSALETQPFGAAVAAAGLLAGATALWCLLRGRSLLDVYVQLPRTAILFWAILLCVASWLYKWAVFAG